MSTDEVLPDRAADLIVWCLSQAFVHEVTQADQQSRHVTCSEIAAKLVDEVMLE